MEFAQEQYTHLIELGIPAEDSRFVIPNAIETVFDIKMNFRELMHFMNERLCLQAQWEIRELATKMKICVGEKHPELIKYLVPKCEKDYPYCFCTESKSRCCGKHVHISEAFQSLIV